MSHYLILWKAYEIKNPSFQQKKYHVKKWQKIDHYFIEVTSTLSKQSYCIFGSGFFYKFIVWYRVIRMTLFYHDYTYATIDI